MNNEFGFYLAKLGLAKNNTMKQSKFLHKCFWPNFQSKITLLWLAENFSVANQNWKKLRCVKSTLKIFTEPAPITERFWLIHTEKDFSRIVGVTTFWANYPSFTIQQRNRFCSISPRKLLFVFIAKEIASISSLMWTHNSSSQSLLMELKRNLTNLLNQMMMRLWSLLLWLTFQDPRLCMPFLVTKLGCLLSTYNILYDKNVIKSQLNYFRYLRQVFCWI